MDERLDEELDELTVINVLSKSISYLLENKKGVIIDDDCKRYIVGIVDDEIIINRCVLDENAPIEFKNLEEGSIIPILGETKLSSTTVQ